MPPHLDDSDDPTTGLATRMSRALGERYAVEREIGRGGMAIVYLAHDAKHQRSVAIKVLKPELGRALGTDRFLREIAIAARLTHPNIVPLYDSGELPPEPGERWPLLYYIMPWLEGESLRTRLERDPQLPIDEALRIAAQVAEALEYAHLHGLIHRDIKPENILLQAGQAVLSDFGIARAVEQAGEPLTESGIAVGTLAYMSPEQAAGKKDLDGRSDLYSLGCVVYEMLTGDVPLAVNAGADTLESIAAELQRARPAVTSALAAVVGKALARLPADRFATGAELRNALATATQGGAWGVGRPVRRVALAVATIAVIAAVWFAARPARHVGGATAARAMKVAVLPLENLTGDPRQEYFSDGLTEELITQLGRVNPGSLGVIARTSAMRYKNSDKPVDQIGRELGVAYVIEGSARRERGRVRIAVQLIRTSDQTQVWADSYDRDLTSILGAQRDVAQGVAGSLQIALLPSAMDRAPQSINPAAYESYLEGRFSTYKLSGPGLDAALRYFQTALDKEPNYALAHSGIAMVWLSREQMGLASPDVAAPKATASALTALRLDSTLAEAHYVLALIRSQQFRWSTADSDFRRAIALNPSFPDVHAYYSHFLNFQGRRADARAEIDEALATDPLNPLFLALDAVDWIYERNPNKAIEQGLAALKTASDEPVALNALWIAYEMRGDTAQAAAFAAKYLSAIGQDSAGRVVERVYGRSGYRAAMRQGAVALAAHARAAYVTPCDVAQLAVSGRDFERTFEWLQHAYDQRDPNIVYFVGDVASFDPVHQDPRVKELRRRLGLP